MATRTYYRYPIQFLRGLDILHFNPNCSQWHSTVAVLTKEPSDEQLCQECKRLEEETKEQD